MWLGPATSSSETLIGTTKGVVKASAIKRFGMTEKWDINAILDMKGTPQRPDPTKPGLHIPVQIRLEPEVPFSMPAMVPARSEEGPRRAYIMKRHFKEHGYTEGCEGCGRLSAGMTKKGVHSDKCRSRMYKELGKTEKGRKWLAEAETRIEEFLEERLKRDHGEVSEPVHLRQGQSEAATHAEEETVSEEPVTPQGDGDPIPELERDTDDESDTKDKRVNERGDDDGRRGGAKKVRVRQEARAKAEKLSSAYA